MPAVPSVMRVARGALVALTLAAGSLVASAGTATAVGPPACGTTNIARNGQASASSQDPLHPPANAIDGNSGTRWQSAPGSPQWITIDLGSTQSLCRVVLNWDLAYATTFQLQVSNDAAAWTSVYTTTTGAGGIQSIDLLGNARYIRMFGSAGATALGLSLREFEIYPTVSPSCGTQNSALGRPATASSQEGPSFAPARAFDGSGATRWSSQFSDPQWISVDLGATQVVCRVTLSWETAYAKAFAVQGSINGLNWVNVYSTDAGTGGTQTIDFVTSARYVRVYGTARATRYGYSLYEFQVFSRFATP